jgi:hypothetical protein
MLREWNVAGAELQEEYCVAPWKGVGEIEIRAFKQAVVVLDSANVSSRRPPLLLVVSLPSSIQRLLHCGAAPW